MTKLFISLCTTICFSLLLFAGNNDCEHMQTNEKGVTIFFPQHKEKIFISNTSDTAFYQFGKNMLKLYKGEVIYNDISKGNVAKGDTIFIDCDYKVKIVN